MPNSTTLRNVWTWVWPMLSPPGVPHAMSSLPFFSAIRGELPRSGIFPPPTKFTFSL